MDKEAMWAFWEDWWAKNWEGWDGAEVSQIAVAFAEDLLTKIGETP